MNRIKRILLSVLTVSLVAIPAYANAADDAKTNVESFETGELSLFNLAEDIDETNDLSDKEPAKVAQLHAKLKSWRNNVGADPMKSNHEYEGNNNE